VFGSSTLRERLQRRFDASETVLWLAAIAGALAFVWPLMRHPGGLYLDRTFAHDALMNIDDLRAIHQNLFQMFSGKNVLDVLYDSSFYFPQPRPLVTSELQLLAAVVTLPLRGHPILAHSILIIVALVLDCVGGAKCAEALGAGRWARLVAGVAFAFSAYTGFQSGRVQLLYLFPIPFAIAAMVHWSRTGSTRQAFAVALWLGALTQLCLYYAMFACALLPALALTMRLSYRRPKAVRDLAVLLAAVLAISVPVTLLLWPYFVHGDALAVSRHGEAILQVNDAMFFAWADRASVWGSLLKDRWQNDSPYFPGALVLLAAIVAVLSAAWRYRSAAFVVIALCALILMPGWTANISVWVIAALLCVASVYLARTGRAHHSFPSLVVLFTVGVFLFGGHWPEFWGYPLTGAPYSWVSTHVPFIGAIRVARRAGILVDLGFCCLAALGLSRIRSPHIAAAVCVLAMGVVYFEAFPLRLSASPLSMVCAEPNYAFARSQGIRTFGEQIESGEPHPVRTMHRVQAAACGIRTSTGQSGITPPLIAAVDDALASLPDRAAHAWLWDAGIHWVMLRGSPVWRRTRVQRLGGHVQRVLEAPSGTFVELARPEIRSLEPPATIEGERVTGLRADCAAPVICPSLVDGDDRTRWSSEHAQTGTETITLRFLDQPVRGLQWNARGFGAELPRGLRLEYVGANGAYQRWGTFAAISPAVLGRRPGRSSIAFSLPTITTGTIRITQIGRTNSIPLSATEIEVIRAR
jgi:hypothetical protein